MSKSFYNYIIEDLLIDWFSENKPQKGSRYYIVTENEEHRQGILNALRKKSSPITIKGIFNSADLEEEGYETMALNITSDSPKLIVGDDKTASEDYLTTLRNAVGLEGEYQNYGILYILSNSVLSSLISSCMNLEVQGAPLHPNYIAKKIKLDVENVIPKKLEQIYLSNHLENVAELIQDGTASLFDFESMMTVLSAESIKGLYNQLDMFEDNSIYNPDFKQSDKDMAERVLCNKKLYSQVVSIMEGDDEDKIKELNRFLDEKLSNKIAKAIDDYKKFDLQDFINSAELKASTENLKLLDIKLSSNSSRNSIIWNHTGKLNKSSRNFIIICEENDNVDYKVILSFNKILSQSLVPSPYKPSGSSVKVPINDTCANLSVGINDNHHDFYIIKIKCNQDFFKDVKHCFSLNKKGEMTVKVPEGNKMISFGNGENEVFLPTPPIWTPTKDEKLVIPTPTEDDINLTVFFIEFANKKLKISLKFNEAKSIPPLNPDSFPQKKTYQEISTSDPFKKITDGDIELSVEFFWRPFLKWEQSFIENNSVALKSQYDSLSQKYYITPIDLSLPEGIKDALTALYAYYSRANSVPSLCTYSQELKSLLQEYCDKVINAIESIPEGESMQSNYYNLTRLGTVYADNKLYLSPFHPLMVAYILEYLEQSGGNDSSYAKKLLTPFYLLPYITYDGKPMRPFSNYQLDEIKNWLIFENAENKPQERVNDITNKMVTSKMLSFIKNFSYLFLDKDTPIIINAIGIAEDANIIKGIIEFIKSQYEKGVQRITLHQYVDDLKKETFFEKLNRLDSIDSIERELKNLYATNERNNCLLSKGVYNEPDIIHQLFTRLDFYKHDIQDCGNEIGYSHITFYQMSTGNEYVNFPTKETRTELAFNGLISIPSTLKKDNNYFIGFGTKGVDNPIGSIHPMTMAYNNLYGNEKNGGCNAYQSGLAVTKKYSFEQSQLLQSIYDNSNWVTFLNPEVDINFFYQPNLYVIHYTDQYSINAKYDSITVTKHIGLYENLLKRSYQKYALPTGTFPTFNDTMKNYFNCLNGDWMLRLVNQTEAKVREKMSLVATSIAMRKFLQRNSSIIWIPISLEEILRVTGEIGLKMDGIFSKKTLGAKGVMSDDLLMVGMDTSNLDRLVLYFYPIEVKFSSNSSMANKGSTQVCHTWLQFKKNLFDNSDFDAKIYKTFFASQFLINAEKLYANNLISSEEYDTIESCRFSLLNLRWNINEILPVKQMGVASVVSFYSTACHEITTKLVENIPICEIHFSENECFEFISGSKHNSLDFLNENAILIDNNALIALSSPNGKIQLEVKDGLNSQTEEGNTLESPLNSNVSGIEQINSDEPSSNASISNVSNSSESEPASNLNEVVSPIQIHVGHIKGNNQLVVFEPNNQNDVSHPNMGIIGTMGTGKTQFARSVIAQFAKESHHNIGKKPIGLLVFDYKGDYKDKEFLETIGGTSYKFNYPFNPLKLVVTEEIEGMNLPAITADRIADSFAKAYGLGLKQQSNIKQVVLETYSDAGITRNPITWTKTTPTMTQVIEKYFDKYDANDKAYALFDKLRDYTIFTDDVSQCVSMFEWLKGPRIIDLTLYPDDTKKVIVSLILDLFYAEMRQLGGSNQENDLRELRAMILVDEAHQFLKKDFNSFRSIISEGRMFGVGMILSTQNIGDFKTSKEDYSQFILSWVIHHVNSISKSELMNIFGSSDSYLEHYIDFISKAKLFESVCKIGQRIFGIRDIPYFELIGKDTRFVSPSSEIKP